MTTPIPTEQQLWMLCLQDKAQRCGGEIPRAGDDAEVCLRNGWLKSYGVGEYVITDEGLRLVARRFGEGPRLQATVTLAAR